MIPADLQPLVRQARYNLSAHRSWCLSHPGQVLELAEAYAAALARLAEIERLASDALAQTACGACYLRAHLESVTEVAKSA